MKANFKPRVLALFLPLLLAISSCEKIDDLLKTDQVSDVVGSYQVRLFQSQRSEDVGRYSSGTGQKNFSGYVTMTKVDYKTISCSSQLSAFGKAYSYQYGNFTGSYDKSSKLGTFKSTSSSGSIVFTSANVTLSLDSHYLTTEPK